MGDCIGMDLKIRASGRIWHDGVDIMLREGNSVGSSITMIVPEEGVMIDPLCSISNKSAQVLMDDLWHAGFRPTEGVGSAGSLAATQKHLEDMREIAFDKLGMKKK